MKRAPRNRINNENQWSSYFVPYVHRFQQFIVNSITSSNQTAWKHNTRGNPILQSKVQQLQFGFYRRTEMEIEVADVGFASWT